MKEFIQSKLKTGLNEMGVLAESNQTDITPHFAERLNDRVLEPDIVTVGYEIGVGNYRVVGKYQIKPETKSKTIAAYDKLKATNFGKNKDVAVMLADLYIQPRDVQFTTDPNESKGQTLVIVDDKTNSNGNRVYAIVRRNVATTLFFGKSYIPITKEKLNVDFILNKF